jgi:hypothetical protein
MVYKFVCSALAHGAAVQRFARPRVLAVGLAVLGPGADRSSPDPEVRVIIRLADAAPRARLLADATAIPMSLEARHELVVEGLRAIHGRSLTAASSVLEEARGAGALIEIERLWIVNAIVAQVDSDWIARLEADPAIAEVVVDERIELGADPRSAGPPLAKEGAADPTEDLIRIGVPEVWAQGITGQGAIVANTDTGVNGEDDTLEDRWRGLFAGPDATWFSPHDLTVFPVDDDPSVTRGHGTATMAIMTGGEASFGVAFDATWIAGDIFRDARFQAEGYVSTALKAFQWLTDPDEDSTTSSDVPDVVSNSYGLRQIDQDSGRIRCDPVFNDAIDAMEAAGVIVVWSAGNEGTQGVTSPANRATSAVNAFAIGGVDASLNVISSSGRGPSLCGGPHATKPDIAAPGAAIMTRNRFDQFANVTGTSFSTPMVAGVLALMRSKNPTITPEAAKTILLETARDLGTPGDDNETGHGLIDAVAALARVPRPTSPLARIVGYRPADAAAQAGFATAQAGEALSLRPGASHEIVPTLTNHGPALSGLSATLSSPTPGVRVTRATVMLAAAETGAFFGPADGESFAVELDAGVTPGADVTLLLAVPGDVIGPFKMILKAGEPVAGTFATHDRGQVRLSVTNFGALGYYTGGHAAGFLLRGDGFRFPPSSPNWLFHASFMAGTSAERLSDDIPYGEDSQNETDFFPVYGAALVVDQSAGGQRIVATYDDRHAIRPLGIRVRQESFAFDEPGLTDFVLLQYVVTNGGSQALTGLRLGLFADWDLPDGGGNPAETAGLEADLRLGFVQGSSAQPWLGLVWLDGLGGSLVTYAVLSNDSIGQSTKSATIQGNVLAPTAAFEDGGEFTDAEKWDALVSGQSRTSNSRPGDLWQIMGGGPVVLSPGATDTVAIGLVAGESREALRQAAATARTAYFERVLGTEPPPPPPPPEEIALAQNFPNPFRAGETTTIRFAIPASAGGGQVDVAVFDVAGRRVRTLVRGSLVEGDHAITWDGMDDNGAEVPAGVYVVRLAVGGQERTMRALVLP